MCGKTNIRLYVSDDMDETILSASVLRECDRLEMMHQTTNSTVINENGKRLFSEDNTEIEHASTTFLDTSLIVDDKVSICKACRATDAHSRLSQTQSSDTGTSHATRGKHAR
jgi:DNA-directed RNA polymerase subunit M/transcription elongation factor TFIIS